jgi:methylmalonyl-CoA/ethylmalonyl-CoA epimerase
MSGEPLLLRQVAQHAENLDRAMEFYTMLLGQEPVAIFNPPGFAFYSLGQTRLLLAHSAPSAMIYLDVDNVQARAEVLRDAGVEIISEPHIVFPDPTGLFDAPGDEWLAVIRDSEGNSVGLMSREKSDANS